MNGLSLDYAGLVHSLRPPLHPTFLGAALLAALADLYEAEHPVCALHQFKQSAATYLFDLASSADLPREDRTVAAWAWMPRVVDQRDTVYQRGFPWLPAPTMPRWIEGTSSHIYQEESSARTSSARTVP